MTISVPDSAEIAQLVARALQEDIGAGDLSAELIAANTLANAHIICRQQAILAGIPWANHALQQLDPDIKIHWRFTDGEHIMPNSIIAELQGNARQLLTAERTVLNFLQTLSATATQTRQYVDAISDTSTIILDTRKTLPGLRYAQKYAVCCGGGKNHRQGLFDAILLKENHIAAAGSIQAAIASARASQVNKFIEVEVENLTELKQALAAQPNRILLDNFTVAELQQAVALTNKQIPLEASGNITLANIRAIAATGVDYISIGALTKNIQAIDLSMRFINEN